jgi:hypothetical protein
MFKQARLLGISLKLRSRRRILVVITFALIAACIAVISAQSLTEAADLVANFGFLVFIVVSRGIFGSVVQQQLFQVYREGAGRGILPGLGLSRPIPPLDPEMVEPDEYEISIRNGAYYQAYQYIAAFSFVVMVVVVWFFSAPEPLRKFLTFSTILVLIAMIVTLPQAIILWQQPDMPEDVAAEA